MFVFLVLCASSDRSKLMLPQPTCGCGLTSPSGLIYVTFLVYLKPFQTHLHSVCADPGVPLFMDIMKDTFIALTWGFQKNLVLFSSASVPSFLQKENSGKRLLMGFIPCGVCFASSWWVREPGEVIALPRAVQPWFPQCLDAALTACERVRAVGRINK